MLLDLPMKHEDVLARMKTWGIEFDSFFDVGAARGLFGSRIRKYWPESQIVFVEAAPYWRDALDQTKKQLSGNVFIEMAAAGERDGELYFRFDPENPYGGSLVDTPSENAITVPVISLDNYISRNAISGKLALKLDVHGAEKAILSGAHKFMSMCELVIFETYNFGPAHRRFAQMAVYLEEQFGMRLVDMAEPKWRPYDNALWQIDFYFARYEGSKLSEWRLT